jgi:hypothetical protein
MAKGARSSSRKANNSKLKSKVFGPVETERTARLSAKLLELASQPKPTRDDTVIKAPESMLGFHLVIYKTNWLTASSEDIATELTPENKPVEGKKTSYRPYLH